MDLDPTDYRSVNAYLRKLEPDGLRILREQFEELEGHAAFQRLQALVTLDREQHVRSMTMRTATPDDRTWEAGYMRGAIALFAVLATVKAFDLRVQTALEREDAAERATRDGER